MDGIASGPRIAALTCAALCCFAANSLLCRMALRPGLIDPASFMTLRLASGAAVLWILARRGPKPDAVLQGGSWRGALWLFAYAVTFSFAYLRLTAGTGALILFGVVQATMLSAGLWSGERPRLLEWLGLLLAAFGLLALTLPGLSAPDPIGAGLMICAGVSWAFYSLRGRAALRPLASNAGNFLRAVPLSIAVSLLGFKSARADLRGVLLAFASGAVASGIGYSIWYTALRGLTSTRAAVVQLAVPALAAAGGILLLAETLSPRLILAGSAILGGVLLATLAHGGARSAAPSPSR
jgi:drug/metabolite transporter (DMT)-like permease